ncbi:phasin family protein [Gammaproteobacteria bacterium]|nr:phasin family protein [Gammaproteobacteria bacterium]
MNKSNEPNYDVVKEFFNINLKIASQFVDQQQAILKLSVDNVTAQMKIFGKSKDYNDVISGQTDLMSETSSKIQDIAKDTTNFMNQSTNEVSLWVEKSMEEAAFIVPFSKSI